VARLFPNADDCNAALSAGRRLQRLTGGQSLSSLLTTSERFEKLLMCIIPKL
jgi:hypothetical protein